jgi:hypothetical protein
MTIKQHQERVADFPTVMNQSGKALDACLLGLISTTGRFQKLAAAGAAAPQVASELAGEMCGSSPLLVTNSASIYRVLPKHICESSPKSLSTDPSETT